MKQILLLMMIFGFGFNSFAQVTYSVSGKTIDIKTKAGVSGMTVYEAKTRKGVESDKNGTYNIYLTTGTHLLRISQIGYKTQTVTVNVQDNTTLNIEVEEVTQELNEVLITSDTPEKNVQKVEMGVSRMNIKSIKKIPAFLGEIDVMRSLQMLPGVTTVGEGSTGINVRGGSIDQNLILMDDAPIFNSSHLFGFFSVFNPDAVRDVSLNRGGISAQFGGRASSVLDIKTKDPAKDRTTVNGGIGLVSSRLAIEGPVGEKFSYFVAARASFNDFLLKVGPASLEGTKASFYDVTAKVNYTPTTKDVISATFYRGTDVFKLPSDSLSAVEVNASSTTYNWTTQNLSARWTHIVSDKFNYKLIGVYSTYNTDTSVPDSANAFNLKSNIDYKNIQFLAGYEPNIKNKIVFGASLVNYSLNPNQLIPGPFSNLNGILLEKEQANEVAIFGEDEILLNEKISLILGLRYSFFQNYGPNQVRTYQAGNTRIPENIVSIKDESGTIQNYGGIEPRMAFRYSINKNSSFKLGYNRMRQYLHLISNTTSALPTARWKTSDNNIAPQVSDQISMGYFQNLKNSTWETSAEVYYKNVADMIDYKDGAKLLLNPTPEVEILEGKGKAYGLEVMIKKNSGGWRGWLAYTYSRAFLQINGNSSEDKVNSGDWYPTNFDKPHNLNLMLTRKLSETVTFAMNFTYSTGRPITYPYSKSILNGTRIPNYFNRNQERIPDYHRLDFSLTFDQNPAKKKLNKEHNWVFGVYNLYANKNAYSVFFKQVNRSVSEAYKLSIFGSLFPSLTYNFKF